MDGFFILAGIVAGFIDAVAGGGGLITVPTISLAQPLGPHAIGTNKIPGTIAALVALYVYWRKGHFDWRSSLAAAVFVWIGSFSGSLASPYFPAKAFRILLLLTCPAVIWLVWRKDLWVKREEIHHRMKGRSWVFYGTCLLVGLYDGAWGPGGGTLMFLTLYFVGQMPLLTAMAGSKLMNFGSAFVSLLSYAHRGFAHPYPGLLVGGGIACGAFAGAHFASRNAVRVVRPVLIVVATLLLAKVWFS